MLLLSLISLNNLSPLSQSTRRSGRNSWVCWLERRVPGRVAAGLCWVSKHVSIVRGLLWRPKKSRNSVYCQLHNIMCLLNSQSVIWHLLDLIFENIINYCCFFFLNPPVNALFHCRCSLGFFFPNENVFMDRLVSVLRRDCCIFKPGVWCTCYNTFLRFLLTLNSRMRRIFQSQVKGQFLVLQLRSSGFFFLNLLKWL